MTPDAKLRMGVYQEGQRAYNDDTDCPYTDWRAGTWGKGYAAALAHANPPEDVTVPCGLCGTPTRMTGTKRCDRCWELETRIRMHPDLARQILNGLGPEEAT